MITENDVGCKLGWVDANTMLRLVREIGLCEGFGNLLGRGGRTCV